MTEMRAPQDWAQFHLPSPPINGDGKLISAWQADVLFILLKKLQNIEEHGCPSIQSLEKEVAANTIAVHKINTWWTRRSTYTRLGLIIAATIFFCLEIGTFIRELIQ